MPIQVLKKKFYIGFKGFIMVRMCEVLFSFVGIVSGKVAGVTWISDLENNDDNKE